MGKLVRSGRARGSLSRNADAVGALGRNWAVFLESAVVRGGPTVKCAYRYEE